MSKMYIEYLYIIIFIWYLVPRTWGRYSILCVVQNFCRVTVCISYMENYHKLSHQNFANKIGRRCTNKEYHMDVDNDFIEPSHESMEVNSAKSNTIKGHLLAHPGYSAISIFRDYTEKSLLQCMIKFGGNTYRKLHTQRHICPQLLNWDMMGWWVAMWCLCMFSWAPTYCPIFQCLGNVTGWGHGWVRVGIFIPQ